MMGDDIDINSLKIIRDLLTQVVIEREDEIEELKQEIDDLKKRLEESEELNRRFKLSVMLMPPQQLHPSCSKLIQ